MHLLYKYRLYPTCAQAAALDVMLGAFCELYNAALQQRIEAYSRQQKSLSYIAQACELKAARAADEGLASFSFTAEQRILRRLDRAFQCFFRRVKRGDAPGYPRFRSKARFHSAEFLVGNGLTLRKNRRIGVIGVGDIKCKWHRPLASATSSALISRQGHKWFVTFRVQAQEAESRDGPTIGLDLGLASIVALSNGTTIQRPNWTKRAASGLRRRQRALARCRHNSKRRIKTRARLAAYAAKVARCRADFLHKISLDITQKFAGIAVEDLNITGLARGFLAKDVLDVAWAQLVSYLRYKAARAGGVVVAVNPNGTSQTCPECGTIKAKALNERTHRCDCGCVLDRDVAAAQIIHLRAFGAGDRPSVAKPAECRSLTEKPLHLLAERSQAGME